MEACLGERVALAVCGCCGDGRLGLGDAVAASPRGCVDAITLLPWSLDSTVPEVTSVACGAYHSLALTADGGLYGWGACDQGQLGTGIAATGTSQPTRIPFFDALRTAHSRHAAQIGSAERGLDSCATPEVIVEVMCGGAHSLVRTTRGLYVAGANVYGQLGLGDAACGADVAHWRLLCPLPLRADDDDSHHGEASGLPFQPSDSSSSAEGGVGVVVSEGLVRGEVSHMSGGTHHTLLAWKDGVLRRVLRQTLTDVEGREGLVVETVVYVYYPVLLTACGKGDFGELGYDADVWAVLRSKDQRVKTAAISAAVVQQQQQPKSSPGGVACDDTNPTATATATATATSTTATTAFYGFAQKWKPTVVRRPEFFASCHRKVQGLPPVEEAATVLIDVSARHNAGAVPCATDVDAAVARAKAASLRTVTVEALCAEHLHSSVTLHVCDKDGSASVEATSGATGTWHWGCYYNNKIEDMNASRPRLVADSEPLHAWHVHAGNERLLRFLPPSAEFDASSISPWSVLGSGNLGLGDDDSFEPAFVPLAVPVDEATTHSPLSGVRRVVGRDHFLAHCGTAATDSAASGDVVCGFGSNLYGELGLPTDTTEDEHTTPTRLLQSGDVLTVSATAATSAAHYRVTRVRDVGAGARHSVFLLSVCPDSPQ